MTHNADRLRLIFESPATKRLRSGIEDIDLIDRNRTEHFDVLIVGAGISGVGSANHLKAQCPEKSFIILESQESFGGTWLTHRYPEVHTLECAVSTEFSRIS